MTEIDNCTKTQGMHTHKNLTLNLLKEELHKNKKSLERSNILYQCISSNENLYSASLVCSFTVENTITHSNIDSIDKTKMNTKTWILIRWQNNFYSKLNFITDFQACSQPMESKWNHQLLKSTSLSNGSPVRWPKAQHELPHKPIR